MNRSTVADRQRGRAAFLQQLDDAAVREKAEKRRQLQRRVERRALQHQVLVEAIALEKELEARRCHLCDLLRAEAWGLGHVNWTERKCARCWAQQADELARQRHINERAPAACRRSPPTPNTVIDAREPHGSRLPSGVRPSTAAGRPSGDRVGPRGDQAAGPVLSPGPELFSGLAPEHLDDVIAALRARDAERLMQLLDGSALARHFMVPGPLATGAGSPPRQASPEHRRLAPPQEQSYDNYYYHDVVLGQLDAGPSAAALSPGARYPATGRVSGGGSADGEPFASPELDDAGGRPPESPSRAAASPPGRYSPGTPGCRADKTAAAAAAPRSSPGSELSFAPARPRDEAKEAAGSLGPGDGLRGAGQGPGPAQGAMAVKVAGYRPEARPLPSKPRAVPADEAELEAALREAEQLVVFGRTQRQRSEALFYSHQLRSALADLRLLRRRGTRAAAVHGYGRRLGPRDGDGVKRIIRESRREQSPAPTAVRRIADPDSGGPYVDPPRRSPRWLEHVHPDRPDPSRAVDWVGWRPASGRLPRPPHTAGLQSAGEWVEYRYDWDLARIRTLPVEDYRAALRREREARSAWAEAQALAQALPESGVFAELQQGELGSFLSGAQ